MKTRNVVLVTMTNNPSSEPPLSLSMTNPFSKITRATVLAGVFLVAAGGTPGYTYAETGLSGTGLSLNTSTGEITGTPTSQGHLSFQATATDSAANSVSANFSIDVISRMDFEGTGPANDDFGFAGSYTFKATDITGATGTISWSASTLPTHYSFNPTFGLLSWTNAAGSSGANTTNNFVITATDSGTGDTLDIPVSHTIYKSFTHNAPTPITIPLGFTSQYDLASLLNPSGFLQPYTYKMIGGYSWMSMSPAGVLTASPPADALSSGSAVPAFNITLDIYSSTVWGHFATVTFTVNLVDAYPSADAGNALTRGSDSRLFVASGGGGAAQPDFVVHTLTGGSLM